MEVSSTFDGGNIICLKNDDPSNIILNISPDIGHEFFQWFYYRLSGAKNTSVKMKISNAGDASYPKGFHGYQAVTSSDRKNWFRVPTTFNNGILEINHTPNYNSQWYAYFSPYSLERHGNLIANSQQSTAVDLIHGGHSIEKRDIDVIRASSRSSSKDPICWIIARQHPGETMAEWLVEGLLQRLLNNDDSLAKYLLGAATFFIVPNMNPDGSFRGHLRTNAAGINLNREWEKPSLNESPEVYFIRNMMEETGCDFFLDIHGDEALPYNFIAGPEGIPSLTNKQIGLVQSYENKLCKVTNEFQKKHGYPTNTPGKANLKIAGNWVAERFGCPSMTLEQPFKDNAQNPEPLQGWSPSKASNLGHDCLEALAYILPDLG